MVVPSLSDPDVVEAGDHVVGGVEFRPAMTGDVEPNQAWEASAPMRRFLPGGGIVRR